MGRLSYLLDSNILSEPCLDGQIAAIAVVNNLTLVTRNTDDFVDFAGLTVENWFA